MPTIIQKVKKLFSNFNFSIIISLNTILLIKYTLGRVHLDLYFLFFGVLSPLSYFPGIRTLDLQIDIYHLMVDHCAQIFSEFIKNILNFNFTTILKLFSSHIILQFHWIFIISLKYFKHRYIDFKSLHYVPLLQINLKYNRFAVIFFSNECSFSWYRSNLNKKIFYTEKLNISVPKTNSVINYGQLKL